MLTAILVLMIFQSLFVMALVGHISTIEKSIKLILDTKLKELELWHGKR